MLLFGAINCVGEMAQNGFPSAYRTVDGDDEHALNDEEKQVFKQMRDAFPEDLVDDQKILRFLIARDFKFEKAKSMLEEHLTWREQNDVDNILKDYPIKNKRSYEFLKKYQSGTYFGEDKGYRLEYICFLN